MKIYPSNERNLMDEGEIVIRGKLTTAELSAKVRAFTVLFGKAPQVRACGNFETPDGIGFWGGGIETVVTSIGSKYVYLRYGSQTDVCPIIPERTHGDHEPMWILALKAL